MIKKIITLFFILILVILQMQCCYATDEIINSQIETLNISSIIKEGEDYTNDVFPDIDLNELLNSTLTGKVNNNNIFKNILSLFTKELINTITTLRNCFNNNCYT